MRLLYTLIFLLAGTSATFAGDCHGYRAPVYAAPTYAHEVAVIEPTIVTAVVPVFVPTFSFTFLSTSSASAVPAATSEPAPFAARTTPSAPSPAPGRRASGSDQETRAAGILRNRCASCHAGQGKQGVSFFDAGGAFHPTVDAGLIWAAADAQSDTVKPMPPGVSGDPGKAVPSEEVALLREWWLSKLKGGKP
jgi:hypothetical protein